MIVIQHGLLPNQSHVHMLCRRNSQNQPHLELQGKEDLVVVAGDPPQLGTAVSDIREGTF